MLVTRDWKKLTEGAWTVEAVFFGHNGLTVALRRGNETIYVDRENRADYDLKIADGYEGPRA
jgi:hypothetical protein